MNGRVRIAICRKNLVNFARLMNMTVEELYRKIPGLMDWQEEKVLDLLGYQAVA